MISWWCSLPSSSPLTTMSDFVPHVLTTSLFASSLDMTTSSATMLPMVPSFLLISAISSSATFSYFSTSTPTSLDSAISLSTLVFPLDSFFVLAMYLEMSFFLLFSPSKSYLAKNDQRLFFVKKTLQCLPTLTFSSRAMISSTIPSSAKRAL